MLMTQQILIIGLGQFGMTLARTLAQKGAEVLAIDSQKSRVEEAAAFVTEAVAIDARDEISLARLEPRKRDVSICAIGSAAKESSILCTALLRQMGAPLVIARANDPVHRRILQLVGAHDIINPEEEFGKRFANRIMYRTIIADTNLGDDLQLTEIHTLPWMAGKTLIELGLHKHFGVMVAGIRPNGKGNIIQPIPGQPLNPDDSLIIVSNETAMSQLIQAKKAKP